MGYVQALHGEPHAEASFSMPCPWMLLCGFVKDGDQSTQKALPQPEEVTEPAAGIFCLEVSTTTLRVCVLL